MTAQSPVLHLRGVVLPGDEPGDEPRDLWLADGVVHTEPVAGARTVFDGGWLLPGLVDAHCHIGLGPDGAVDAATARTQAVADRDTGVLLVRDAGVPEDTRWVDACPDLPRIIRAGRHVARPKRYIRGFAVEVDPDGFVAEVAAQAARGDGWVKIVGDWIDRATGDLEPLWPADVARAAIDAAHAAGARVTAHCFAEQSAHELVRAGIDCVEHGAGLDEATIELMARRGVALVPTMVNLDNFPDYAAAGEEKFPKYAAHMRALHASRHRTIGAAREAGVPIYAGTDAGGVVAHGRVQDELAELARLGGAEFALGAASWRAREWLEVPSVLEDGAWADLVGYDTDPRLDVTVRPSLVVLRGQVV